MPELRLEITTVRLEKMRIPSLAMAGSAKEIAITFCVIGLMAGSLCVGSIDGQTLNQQEQEKVPTASTRRRLLPQLSRIHHPALKQNFLPSYSPSRPVPKESYYGPPATPTSKESYPLRPGPPAATHNQAAYKSVNCGDRLCPGIRIGRNIFVLEYEN